MNGQGDLFAGVDRVKVPPRFELSGRDLKAQGQALADAAAAPDWKAAWDGAIERLAASGVEFTTDTVRELAGAPTDHPNAAGARFTAAARRGLIRKVGYRPSERAPAHTRPLAVWKGAGGD